MGRVIVSGGCKMRGPVVGETWVINETPQNSDIVDEGEFISFDLKFRSNNEAFSPGSKPTL